MQELLGLLGLAGGAAMVKDSYDTLGEVGEQGLEQGREIGLEGQQMADFTGYGVTGPVGSQTVDADGNSQFDLGAQQQGMMDQYGAASSQFAGAATMDQGAREQDIYNATRAMQQPGEDRAALNMENRLQQQGRGGISTAAYGGTPQEFAMHKANAEARNSAAFGAMQGARQQQAQDVNSANMFGQLQYAPQSALLDTASAGNQAFGFQDVAQRQGANMFSEGAMGGLDASLGAQLGQANLAGNVGVAGITAGASILGQAAGGEGDFWTGLLDSINPFS